MFSIHSIFIGILCSLVKQVPRKPSSLAIRTVLVFWIFNYLRLFFTWKYIATWTKQVFFESLELLNLLHFLEIHFELCHGECCLHLVFLGAETFDVLLNYVAFLIHFSSYLEFVCFIKFLVLLVIEYIIGILIDFCLRNIWEDVLDRFHIMINNEEFSFIFLASALKQHAQISSETFELSKTNQSHV